MLISQTKTEVKKSKFLGYLEKINSSYEIDNILEHYRKQHKKANHICVGILFGSYEKFYNDKEVGQTGKILLYLLRQNKLDSHILIVVRYFGGIKLGQGGVQRAFRECGKELIEKFN